MGSVKVALGAFAVFVLCDCVFPSRDVTGMELAWTLSETNTLQGDEYRRIRSCEGAFVTQVQVDIHDLNHEERRRTFAYDCEQGFQTPEQAHVSSSDVFVSLRPGKYQVELTAMDDPEARQRAGEPQTRIRTPFEVTVSDKSVAVLSADLSAAVVSVTLDLAHVEACERLVARLVYADPEHDLPGYGWKQGDPAVLYREGLRSSGSEDSLVLDGTEHDCRALVDGAHVFSNVDVGHYTLELSIDRQSCTLDLWVEGELSAALDLADLACEA